MPSARVPVAYGAATPPSVQHTSNAAGHLLEQRTAAGTVPGKEPEERSHPMARNPRRSNGTARDRVRARWRAIGGPCALCGRPIDYDLGMVTTPDGKRRPHPMSFVVDEIIPVSRGGSPFDMENTRPAHWICNARRGDGTKARHATSAGSLPLPFDDW